MTNSPTFDKQLALNQYWKDIGGRVFLPGTNRAADRFARTCGSNTLCGSARDKFLIGWDSIAKVSIDQRIGCQRVKAVDIIQIGCP
jgi:hypothetical protein